MMLDKLKELLNEKLTDSLTNDMIDILFFVYVQCFPKEGDTMTLSANRTPGKSVLYRTLLNDTPKPKNEVETVCFYENYYTIFEEPRITVWHNQQ